MGKLVVLANFRVMRGLLSFAIKMKFFPTHEPKFAGKKMIKVKLILTIYSFCRKYDLYTKSEEESALPDIEALKPYYQGLIDQYCPGVLKW